MSKKTYQQLFFGFFLLVALVVLVEGRSTIARIWILFVTIAQGVWFGIRWLMSAKRRK